MRASAFAMLWILGTAAVPSQAVYKCKGPGGTPVFQEVPCPGDGELLKVKPASGSAPIADRGEATTPPSQGNGHVKPPESLAERLNRHTEATAKERRLREIQTIFLPRARAQLLAHRAACDNEYRALQKKKALSANNLAGATWEQSISSEMSALMSRCDSRARDYERDIDQLTRECASLGGGC